MGQFDVLIIGNGIIGCSTAYALLKKDPSLKIRVIGPKVREGGATVAAGAMINCFAEATTQTFKTIPNRTKFDQCYTALKMWPQWLEEINQHLPFEDRLEISKGTYVVLNSRCGPLDTDNFHAILEALTLYKEPFEEINPSEIEEINPLQGCRPLRALWIPEEGAISTHEVLSAFDKILGPDRFLFEEAESIIVEGGSAKGVRLASGEKVLADKVLLAAGAFSQKILDKLPEVSQNIPLILAGVGYSIIAEQNPDRPVRHVIRTPNRAGACGLHVMPRNGDTIYIGASNDLSFYPHVVPKMGMLNFLMECTFQQIDQQLTRSKLLHCQVGNRPATIDSFPLIGELSISNLFLMTGTYRDGFHQSPLLASHMAEIICGDEGLISDMFRPERPLIQVKNKSDSIEEYLTHFQGSSYEHNLLLPTGILTDQEYLKFIRERTERLYEELGTDFGFPPDVLFMFDLDAENYSKIKMLRSYLQNKSYEQAEIHEEKVRC